MTRKLSALAGLGMVMGTALALPSLLSAQGGFLQPGINKVPDPNAKRILITVFRNNASNVRERTMGVEAADALRSHITSDFPFKQVYVLPRTEIEQYLTASGFPTTEALAPHDARALAGLVRADEYLTGIVTKIPTGYRIEANLVLARDQALIQPLGTYEGKNLGDATNGVSKELKEARKQLDFEQKCINSARDKKYDAALAFAKEGVLAYPKATLARICQLNVMKEQKAPSAQMMALAKEIVKLHPQSRPGLANLADAYREAKMQDSAVVTLLALLATDPANPRLQHDVVESVAALANPKVARPVIDTAVAMNPGEPDLLRLRWLILNAVRDFKEMHTQGEELVRLDTSFADTTFFIKEAIAYQNDSAYQKASEMSARGLSKFPGQATLTYMQIVTLKQAGQNQQALDALEKARAAKIPVENGSFIRMQLLTDLNRTEEILPALKEMIASGDTATLLRQQVLKIGNEKRVAAKTAEEYDAALAVLMYADTVSKGQTKAQAGFLIGATYVTYGQLKLNTANATKNCQLAKDAKNMFADAQIMLPRGGATYVDAMRTLMGAVVQLDPAADEAIKKLCK